MADIFQKYLCDILISCMIGFIDQLAVVHLVRCVWPSFAALSPQSSTLSMVKWTGQALRAATNWKKDAHCELQISPCF